MRKHKGLTKGKSILFHGIQQLSAFLAVFCVVILVFYSFTSVRTNNANYPAGRISYDWNLFSQEESFEETSTFDYMLMNALQEIIRYNVAKSQLEVDGQFDGTKVIDVRAFANRKNALQNGMDTIADSVEGKFVADASQVVTARYYLEDLLKWGRYGITYDMVTMTEEQFVSYFGDDYLKLYDGNLTEAQWSVLEAALGSEADTLIKNSYETYGYTYDGYTYDVYGVEEYGWSDAGAMNSMTAILVTDEAEVMEQNVNEEAAAMEITVEGEQAEAEPVYSVICDPRVHQAFADILLQNSPIAGISVDANGEVVVTLNVLMERYQTEDGKDLLSLVGNWADYMTLAAQVEQAVEDLDYNYNEYLNFKERYSSASTTNIVYTFEMTMMGEKVRVSNLEVFDKVDLDEFYSSNYGRYMIYRPQTMTFESNTGIIEESDLFEAFSNYEYAYPDTAKIWLAVDTTYPANDQFAQAAAAYSFLHPYAYLVLGIAIVCVIVWVVMFLFLSVMTGYRRKKEETEAILILNWFDSIPTEIALALGGGVAVGVLFLLEELLYNQSGVWIDYICDNRMKATLFLSILGMFGSGLFCLFWYSLLRRIKAHTLWKSSLLHIIWQSIFGRIFNAIKKPVLKMYDNSSILFRCVLSLGIVMFVDFLLGALCYKYWRYLLYHSPGRLLLLMLFILLVNLGIIYLWFLSHMKRKAIVEGIARIRDGEVNYQVETKGMHGENLQLAEAVNSIGEGIKNAVETSMKDERLKADLITNVSHDIKTPLTSIINYVDLLKREKIETEPVKGYIEVLDAKSQRLKQLTDDLVEASKISSGNITLIMEKINLTELLSQSLGEFSEKFEEKNLQVVESLTGEAVYIEADSRRIWRVVENLFGNIYKYALPGTRVYLDMALLEGEDKVALSIKNISAQPMNIEADELTERFIRGDVSRSTEGSGLGLSIARNLTELQNGKFDIYLDGDLFKVTLTFPLYAEREN